MKRREQLLISALWVRTISFLRTQDFFDPLGVLVSLQEYETANPWLLLAAFHETRRRLIQSTRENSDQKAHIDRQPHSGKDISGDNRQALRTSFVLRKGLIFNVRRRVYLGEQTGATTL